MLTNKVVTTSIVFLISIFFASVAVNADYALDGGGFTSSGGQVNSDNYELFSSFWQSQPIEVPVGNATSNNFKLYAGFLVDALGSGGELMGYIARQAISRTELERLIDSGATAAELAGEICSRIDAQEDLVLGFQPFSDWKMDVKLTQKFRDRHVYVIGKSGSGKTNLLRVLIDQDLWHCNGVGVIAPEAEMIEEEILPYIPDHRVSTMLSTGIQPMVKNLCVLETKLFGKAKTKIRYTSGAMCMRSIPRTLICLSPIELVDL